MKVAMVTPGRWPNWGHAASNRAARNDGRFAIGPFTGANTGKML
jgi:hypothetical protein